MRSGLKLPVLATTLLGLFTVASATMQEIWSDSGVSFVWSARPGADNMRSNAVEVMWELDPAFALTGQATQNTIPGSTIHFSHELTSRSATALRVRLNCENQRPDQFELQDIVLFRDTNANGVVDAGEVEIIRNATALLQPGEKVHLALRSRVPLSAPARSIARVAITAHDADSELMAIRVDGVNVQARPDSAGLLVEKTVSRPEAAIGETVDYTIHVKNVTAYNMPDVILQDDFPRGFDFVRGTLRFGDALQPNPKAGFAGGIVVGELAGGASFTIHYRARVGPLALRGDGINRATASALGFTSNVALAQVNVREEVFNSRGVIIGRVFIDENGNDLADATETGVPGVRVYLEDGTYAISDADGKYSFYGLNPRTHVLKLDATSLPAGTVLAVIAQAQLDAPDSRLVDLSRYEMRKANFAVKRASTGARAEIAARRAALRPGVEIARELKGRLTADGLPVPVTDVKALPSAGVMVAASEPGVIGPKTTVPMFSVPGAQPAAPAPAMTEDALLAALTDNKLGFVNLREGAILPAAQTDILVKGPTGVSFELAVNGAIIGGDRVGTKGVVTDRQIVAWNFVGVDLHPGGNRLRVTMTDAFGNVRGSETIQVLAPGALAVIKLTAPNAIADGVTPATVNVDLLDAQGTPVTARTPVTLVSALGEWQDEDLDPATPGLQAFIEGGHRSFLLTAPLEPGESDLLANSGIIRSEGSLDFRPNLRPLLAAGVVEGSINLGTRARGALLAVDARDAFAEELRGLSATSQDGRISGGARAAFFLKGKIRGDYLLTASFDSDKAARERLFRDIQPGEFYPVYGDSSVRGYDAQSTGKLYVRLDRGHSYALLGDFTTQPVAQGNEELRSLGGYQRSLTGAKEHYESNRITANVWASQDTTRQFVGELPGNGTSGPYDFKIANALTNSERIEVLTRDRNQTGLVITTRPLQRFFDYEFEPFTGRLLLRAPVPSVDADLNPVSIRITCEVDQGGKKFFVYGADAEVKVTPKLDLGAGYARDENPADQRELMSVAARLKLMPGTVLTAEIAASRSELAGSGLAGRIDFTRKVVHTDIHAWVGRTDPEFRNPAALLLPGRLEGGFKATHQFAASVGVVAQGLVTEDVATGGRRQGVRIDVEKAWGAYKLAAGVRHSDETAAPANAGPNATPANTVDSVRVKLTLPVPYFNAATGFLEYEQDVRDPRKQLAATGFDYSFRAGGRAYARHEFISALGGPFELNDAQRNRTTVAGFERDYMKDGRIFNEYRAGNEVYGREAEAALGLRNLWTIAPGVRANTTFERITPVTGGNRNESTALTGALDLATATNWRADARLEVRVSPTSDSVLNTLGYARQLNRGFTFLGKTILLLTRVKGPGAGDLAQGRLQAGLAWRPTDQDRWNALGKYELKWESDSRAAAAFSSRLTHLWSGDVNYQPTAGLVVSGHYAAKWVQESGPQGADDYCAHLVAGRAGWEFGARRRVGFALNVSALANGTFTQCKYALGPELDFLLGKNLQLGLGYNFTGFRDRDLAADGSWAQGAYLRLRLKFDEAAFTRLTPKDKS